MFFGRVVLAVPGRAALIVDSTAPCDGERGVGVSAGRSDRGRAVHVLVIAVVGWCVVPVIGRVVVVTLRVLVIAAVRSTWL
jgi:hypothetical protein